MIDNNILLGITREGYRAYMNDLNSGIGTRCPYLTNQDFADAWRKGYYLAINETGDGA